ncbi:MAG: DNA-formamidopyrimidine glycosylase family protein, partial [Microthrixaceae bacterium]
MPHSGVPELPEVETIRRQLDPLLAGSVVVDAWAFPSPKFTDAPLAVGARIDGVRRRGKYLLLPLDHDGEPFELVVHLGMTGRLAVDDGTSRSIDGRASQPIDGRASQPIERRASRSIDGGTSSDTTRAPQPTAVSSWEESAFVPRTDHLRARWLLDDGRTLWFD